MRPFVSALCSAMAICGLYAPPRPALFANSQQATGVLDQPLESPHAFGDFFGEISNRSFIKNNGDFDRFYAGVATSAEGWYLEYWLEGSERNEPNGGRLVKPGRASAADFVLEGGGKGGSNLEIQCKRTLDASHVADPKYDSMTFITTRQARSALLLELEKEELKAAARKVALAPRWQAVRIAFDEGRIPAFTPVSQTPIPGASELKLAKRELERQWRQLARVAGEWDRAVATGAKSMARAPASIRCVNSGGLIRAVAAGAAVGVLLEGGLIWYRVHNGEISSSELPDEIAKSALRVGVVVAIETTLFVLSPTPAGWVVVAVAVAATAAASTVDAAVDLYKDRFGWKPVTIADLRPNHPELGEWVDWFGERETARWRAAVRGDSGAWERDWTPAIDR